MTAPTPITDEQLAQWEKLCEEATEGPLECHQGVVDGVKQCHFFVEAKSKRLYVARVQSDTHNTIEAEANAKLFTASRTALPALIAEVKRQRVESVVMREALEFYADVDNYKARSDTCDVCGNTRDAHGYIIHGKGCHTQSEDGGGESYEGSDITADDGTSARTALSSTTDLAGKVVVDREEWEAVNKVADADTGREMRMSAGGYKDWQKNASTFDIDQAVNDLWVIRTRLDAIRKGGGE